MRTFRMIVFTLLLGLLSFSLIACNGDNGVEGAEPEFRTTDTHLQWRLVGDDEWIDLMELDDLKGPAGADGQDGTDGTDGTDGVDGIDGADGKDGVDGQDGTDGQDGVDGIDGLSAYEIYLKYFPEYPYDEEQWTIDLVSGKLAEALEHSIYEFEHNADDLTFEDKVGQVATITLKPVEIHHLGYDNVRFNIDITGPGDVEMYAEDSEGKMHDVASIGYWGPEDGFYMARDYEATTDFELIFEKPGEHTIEIALVQLTTDITILEETITIEVEAIASEYEFVHDVDETDFFVNIAEEVDITLQPLVERTFGYDSVRFNVAYTGPGTLTLMAEDSEQNWYDVAEIGHWGPSGGFELPKDYSATTTFEATFDEEGEYTITFELYDLNAEEAILVEEIVVEVREAHSVYAFDYDIDDIMFMEDNMEEFSVRLWSETVYHLGYDSVRFNVSYSGPGTLTLMAEDSKQNWHDVASIGYWGPPGGFELPADYDEVTLFETTFSEKGQYTITFELYDLIEDEAILTEEITIDVYEQLLSTYHTGFESHEGFTARTNYMSTIEEEGMAPYTWTFYYGTPSTNNTISGNQSAQMRWYTSAPENLGTITSEFTVDDLRMITFNAKRAGAEGIALSVAYSMDGDTWHETIYELTTSAQSFRFEADLADAAYIRFGIAIPGDNPSGRADLILDDIVIYSLANENSLEKYLAWALMPPMETAVDLILPTEYNIFDWALDVAWASDNTDVIENDGTVHQPAAGEDDETVMLTATVTNGGINFTYDFYVTVLAEPLVWAYEETFAGIENFSYDDSGTIEGDSGIEWTYVDMSKGSDGSGDFVQIRPTAPMSSITATLEGGLDRIDIDAMAFGGGRSFDIIINEGEADEVTLTVSDLGTTMASESFRDLGIEGEYTITITNLSHALKIYAIYLLGND